MTVVIVVETRIFKSAYFFLNLSSVLYSESHLPSSSQDLALINYANYLTSLHFSETRIKIEPISIFFIVKTKS